MDLLSFFGSDLEFVAEFVYEGAGVSFNQIYSQGTWYTRSSIKKKYRSIFNVLIESNKDLCWIDKYVIDLSYNSRHDPDNVVAMEKVFIDALKQEVSRDGKIIKQGYIKDDSKKYCRGVILRPDEELPFNTFKFTLYRYKDGADKKQTNIRRRTKTHKRKGKR